MYIYFLGVLHLLRCDCVRGISLTPPRVLVLYMMCLGLPRQVFLHNGNESEGLTNLSEDNQSAIDALYFIL